MMGKSNPPVPKAEPPTPVPQEDDPRGVEEQRKVAARAKEQGGTSAHLLTGPEGIEDEPKKRERMGTY
jgi:hypothetical protein